MPAAVGCDYLKPVRLDLARGSDQWDALDRVSQQRTRCIVESKTVFLIVGMAFAFLSVQAAAVTFKFAFQGGLKLA